MARHSSSSTPAIAGTGAGTEPFGRYTPSRRTLPGFAFCAALAFVLVLIVAPRQAPAASAETIPAERGAQSFVAGAGYTQALDRDNYGITKKVVVVPPALSAPAVGIPDPGTAQAIGYALVHARGWGDDEFACLVSLFNRESHWNVYASNPSGAYGIPQALPGSKMASAGADWATNPATQITWGLGYIQGRYGTPCGAWAHSQSSGWY